MENNKYNEFDNLKDLKKSVITDWANEPTVEDLKKDLDISTKSHDDHVQNIKRWNDLKNIEGEYKPVKIAGRSIAQPKLIRTQAEWRYSAISEQILNQAQLFKVVPRTFEDVDNAKQNELVINYQFDTKINKIDFINKFVRHNVDEGSCVVRVSWLRETEEVTVQVPIYEYFEITDEEQLSILEQAISLKQTNPLAFNQEIPETQREAVNYYEETQVPTVVTIAGYTEQVQEKVIENKPVLHILDLETVYVDPHCKGDIDKANFIIIAHTTSKAELLKEGKSKYSNLDKVDWDSAGTSTHEHLSDKTNLSETSNFTDDLRKKVIMYEYWGKYDTDNDGILQPIVASWVGDTIIRMESNPFPDGKPPIVITNYNPEKNSVFGIPDAELLEENQKTIGGLKRAVIDTVGRSAAGQIGFRKHSLDHTNKEKFTKGLDFEYNLDQGSSLSDIFKDFTTPDIPQSVITLIALETQQAESITGIKSFSTGINGDTYGNVATNTKAAISAAGLRENSIIRRLTYGLSAVANKIIGLNKDLLDETEVVRISNQEFISITPDDLKGDFDIKVDVSNNEVDEAKAQELAFMLQTMGNNLGLDMIKLILSKIAYLRKMPELAESIEAYQPQPDPVAEKLKELQVAELEAKIEKLKAEAEEERSKAQLLQVQASEEITGNKQKKDLEKMKQQSSSQQELAITQSLAKSENAEDLTAVQQAMAYKDLNKILEQ